MADTPLPVIARIGSFHIAGRAVTVSGIPTRNGVFSRGSPPWIVDMNGQHEAEQMYVHYVRLAAPRAQYPLLMWHGGGMTGVTWEDTPDGRPGWQSAFLRAGHDVYVCDAVERGRASWCCLPGVYESTPVARGKRECWEGFRFGPAGSWHPDAARRRAHAGLRFPVAALDAFARQIVPRWTTNDAPTQRAYDALLGRVGPAVVMAHSQGGNFAFAAALRAPDSVRAVIAIEPGGAPEAGDLTRLRGIPHLVLWGDYIEATPRWVEIRARIDAYAAAVSAQGGSVESIDLPARGIAGNSHFPMMDDNSDAVAALIQDWMARKGLMA